jgi:hypothetical protein
MRVLCVIVSVAGCTPPPQIPRPTPVETPLASPAKPSPACATPEHRQLDFWVGDWDVTVHARATPDGPWGDAKGRQHVESILGGCAIAEAFSADGPGTPWNGLSYSSWQAPLGKWRQTWVDDSGGYLAFTGALEAGVVTLVGESRVQGDKTIQMRMVFSEITPRSLHWEWQRTDDDWKTSTAMMKIDYVRR